MTSLARFAAFPLHHPVPSAGAGPPDFGPVVIEGRVFGVIGCGCGDGARAGVGVDLSSVGVPFCTTPFVPAGVRTLGGFIGKAPSGRRTLGGRSTCCAHKNAVCSLLLMSGVCVRMYVSTCTLLAGVPIASSDAAASALAFSLLCAGPRGVRSGARLGLQAPLDDAATGAAGCHLGVAPDS